MDIPQNGSRRAFLEALCAIGLVVPFAVAARAETEAERKIRIDKETKSTAWIFGAALSKATLMRMVGDEAEYQKNFSFADRAAALLGVEIKPLPAKFDPPENAIKYLGSDEVIAIAQLLAKKYSREHGELFEVAMKTNVAGLFYWPDSKNQNRKTAEVLKSRYQSLHLPANLWTEFLTAIIEGKPRADLFRLTEKTILAVSNYLNPRKQ